MTLDERNLQSHLVKILHTDGQTVNGTGFICHPEGYILTCYHVIEPNIKAERTAVTVNYHDESYRAQICKNYCNVEADIAVVKLVEQEELWPYIDLDVHKRWYPGDTVSSFGYPQDSSFRKTGIGITAKLTSATKDERTEVVQIIGDTLENVAPGFSGAPVLHQRTKKAIGLVNSKYESRQAFLVPLDTLYRQWPELRDFHDVFEKIRSNLADEAQEKLNEKIKDTPFIPLRLECGKIPEKPTEEEDERLKEKEWQHSRKWEDFDIEELLPFYKPFILSSSVGTGKTTFLYWLVTKIVANTDIVPVFITCAEFESTDPNTWDDLEKRLVSNYKRDFLEEDLEDFFNMYFKNHKIVFLCDGLDQIRRNDYSGVADRMFKICSPNPVLISSRPSSVISLETKPEILFLRLKPFSLEEQRQYFGEHFEKTERLSLLAPDLVRIPMLAYMVRALIRQGEAEGVSSRTELYQRFIDYIIHKHEPNVPISSDDFQLTEDVYETLKRLSFEALSLKEPQIQKISLGLYTKGNFKIDVAELTTFGLVSRILERGDLIQRYLFYTHQSFQEFLAAQYANDHEELVEKVLDEMWAPKWKEVIKFLSGLRGQEIIEEILEKDNIIHAGLFLAVECVAEVKETDKEVREFKELKGAIGKEVRELVNLYPFMEHAIHSLKYLKDVEQLTLLIKDKSKEAVQVLADIKENVDDMTLRSVVDLLEDAGYYLRFTVIDALAAFKDRLDKQDIRKIVGPLENSVSWDFPTINALAAFKDRLDEQDISKIVGRLENESFQARKVAIKALVVFKDMVRKQDIRKVVGLLEDEEWYVRKTAIKAMVSLKDELGKQDIRKVVGLLEDKEWRIRTRAIKALVALKEDLDEQDIRKVVDLLEDENSNVRGDAVDALVALKDQLGEQDISKVIGLLKDESRYVQEEAIESLVALRDKLGGQDISKIVGLLEDENSDVREAAMEAIEALVALKDQLGEQDISKIVGLLEDEGGYVRFKAIKALAVLKVRLGKQGISKVIGLLENEDWLVRNTTIEALVALKDQLGEQDISKIVGLLEDESQYVRNGAITVLAALKVRLSKQGISKVIGVLEDKDSHLRDKVIRALVALKDQLGEQDISKIVGLLENESSLVRVSAIDALVALKVRLGKQDISKIVGLLADESDYVRQKAIEAVVAFKVRLGKQGFSKVIGLLGDYYNVRDEAIRALVAFKGRLAKNDILKISERLNDGNKDVRLAVYNLFIELYESGIPLP